MFGARFVTLQMTVLLYGTPLLSIQLSLDKPVSIADLNGDIKYNAQATTRKEALLAYDKGLELEVPNQRKSHSNEHEACHPPDQRHTGHTSALIAS